MYMNPLKLLEDNTEEQASLFNALADPTRLKIVKLLCQQQIPDALCVNALASLLGVSQSAVSQHLRLLKAIGLVKGERRGYHVHYSIDHDRMQRYRELVLSALDMSKPIQEELCQSHSPE
jgi:ArsR family transcriptional regulator